MSRYRNLEKRIAELPKEDSVPAAYVALETFNIDAENLSSDQQFELAVNLIKQRSKRTLASLGLFALLSIVSGATFLLGLEHSSEESILRERSARLQEIVSEIQKARHQLEQELHLERQQHDNLRQRSESLVSGLASTSVNLAIAGGSDQISPQVRDLLTSLQALLNEYKNSVDDSLSTAVYDFEIRLAEATIANAEGRFGKALELLNESEASRRANAATVALDEAVKVNFARGYALSSMGDSEGALTCYNRILRIDPINGQVMLLTASCMVALGNRSDAIALLQRIVEDPTLYLSKLESNVEKARTLAWSYVTLSHLAPYADELTSATDLQTSAIAAIEASKDDGSIVLALDRGAIYSLRAESFESRGQHEQAIADLVTAIESYRNAGVAAMASDGYRAKVLGQFPPEFQEIMSENEIPLMLWPPRRLR